MKDVEMERSSEGFEHATRGSFKWVTHLHSTRVTLKKDHRSSTRSHACMTRQVNTTLQWL